MKHYYAKVLWFGEYAVIKGAPALAAPLPDYYGTWQLGGDTEQQRDLPAFAKFLREQTNLAISYDRLHADLQRGLFFQSNIPVGYGLGSSGALCAGLYHQYGLDHFTDEPRLSAQAVRLREVFSRMEGFFHGSSSGTDPLISFLDQPVVIHGEGRIESVASQFPPTFGPLHFFLVDTATPRQTGPLVQHFLERCADAAFAKKLEQELVPSTEQAIQAFLEQDWEACFTAFGQISAFQLDNLPRLIPQRWQELWRAALRSDHLRLKLCGAGGGGFLLGVTREVETARKLGRVLL